MSKNKEMQKIKILINNCKKCSLYKTSNKPVPGCGSLNSKIMLVGEAPGYNEDIQGKPFVGKAGKILDEILELNKLNRKEIYITNIIKCRPPKNRKPFKKEIKSCKFYLDSQIEIIKPIVIAPMGNSAVSYILDKFNLKIDKIGDLHGKIFEINTANVVIKIIPLYHPAVATYNINMKKILVKDFKLVKKSIENNHN